MSARANDITGLVQTARQANDQSLDSPDARAALEKLLELDEDTLENLLSRLRQSEEPDDRVLAARLLATRASSGDHDRLLSMADDEQAESVLAAIADGLRQSIEHLQVLAKHQDDRLRRLAAARLYGKQDERTLELLLWLLQDRDVEVRDWAAWALADGFPSSRQRDAALDRWLRTSPPGSQLAGQVRLALQGEGKVRQPGQSKTRKRDHRPTDSAERLVVLVTSANPIDTNQLALDEEVRDITTGLRATPSRDVVDLRTAWATRPLDLLVELNERHPAVLHFSGHGTPDGRLVFLDAEGEAKPVEGEAFAASLKTAGESVRVVVLNACFSAELARSLTRYVDVAVGMDRPVEDDAARVFARQFYSALGYGRSVGNAFDQARAALGLETIGDLHAPQLSSRAGVDPYELVLVDPSATRRYVPAGDREVLTERTATHLAYLSRHTTLPFGDGIRVQRALGAPLRHRAQEGSMLLVGSPGSGKTGALYSLAQELREEGRDVVVLAADLLGASGQRGLAEELGLERNVFDALAAWPGHQPGFLFIDALDAARGREAAGALLSLIAQIALGSRRWHVIASIRSFDLRHSPELRDAFAVQRTGAEDFTDPEFISVKHFAVGELTEPELEYVARAAPAVGEFLALAPAAARELARIPFNLRLLCSLLARENAELDRLRAVRTQLQLLDVYWDRRVLEPLDGRDARERLAERFCEHAVKRLRLQVPRRVVLRDPGDAASLNALLFAGVLAEESDDVADGEYVAFAHHLLFDYAVHRLLLAGGEEDVAARLEESDELVLLARPSLVLRLLSTMQADESWQGFWRLALRLASVEVPVLARLTAPAVAVEQIGDARQFSPLLAALENGDLAAAFLLRHVVSARAALGRPAHPLAGADFEPWSVLADHLARNVTVENAYPLRLLVWGLTMERDDLSPVELELLGRAARGLLAWAWRQDQAPWVDIQTGLEAVARSCASDPPASRAVLSVVISPERVATHGYQELRPLAEEVPHLLGCLPDLVGDLYETAFGRDEPSKDPTSFGAGQILALTSTRQQDWDMIRYALAEQYPLVIERDPDVALRAAAAASLHEGQRSGWGAQGATETFQFRGRETGIIDDASAVWDSRGNEYRDSVRLLNALQAAVSDAARAGSIDRAEALLDAVAAGGRRPAAIYRRLLRAGADVPEVFAPLLLELVLVEEVLIDLNTSEPAGAFIAAASEHWDSETRERLEQVIMRVPERFAEDRHVQGLHVRDRLIGCLAPETVVTESVRRVREDLEQGEGLPANLEPFSVTTEWRQVDPEEGLRARGVDTQAAGNRRLLDLIAAVREFVDAHRNAPPSGQEADQALPAIHALRAGRDEPGGDAAPDLLAEAQAWLSEAAAVLASQTPLFPGSESVRLAHELALEGAHSAHPTPPDEAMLEQFEEGPYWGVPSGRIEAARALLLLTREPVLTDEATRSAIMQLASDPVPGVRWTVAHLLGLPSGGQGEWAWRLVERMAAEESSAPVLASLLHSIARLARERPQAGFDIVAGIYEREQTGRRRESLMSEYAGFLLDGWVWNAYPAGRMIVDGWLADPAGNAKVARGVFFRLRKPVTTGDDTPDQIAVRQRAIGVWADLTRAAWGAFEASNRGGEQDMAGRRDLAQLVDTSASELYFASGAHAERQPDRNERFASRVRRRFYREGDPIIEVLTTAGIPSVAHHVLQTLATYVEEDPRGVLLRIGKVLDAGRAWGYQLESLAEAEFVALVERYLAAHRDLFLRDRECRDVLVRASESFVEAGWPSARRLIYGLDDMFR